MLIRSSDRLSLNHTKDRSGSRYMSHLVCSCGLHRSTKDSIHYQPNFHLLEILRKVFFWVTTCQSHFFSYVRVKSIPLLGNWTQSESNRLVTFNYFTLCSPSHESVNSTWGETGTREEKSAQGWENNKLWLTTGSNLWKLEKSFPSEELGRGVGVGGVER